MSTRRVGVTGAIAEALFNTRAALALTPAGRAIIVERDDLMELLAHVSNLEFANSRLRGTLNHTHPLAALHNALSQGQDL